MNAVLQSSVYTVFDISIFGLAVRLRGHKQRKLNGDVYLFLLFVSSDLGLTIKLDFNISNPLLSLRIGSCLACVYRVMEARGKFGEHERSVRVARGAAESNSSFLSALQTYQVHP